MKVNVQTLKQEKLNPMLNQALKAPEIPLLMAALDINESIVGVQETKGYELNLEYVDQDNVILETLFLYLPNDNVIEISKKQQDTAFKKIVAHFTSKNGDKKVIKRMVVNKGSVEALAEIPFKESYFDFLGESNKSVENEVKAEAWYDGCLVFGDPATGYHFYRHCGAKCGDNGDTGGGTPINDLDTCCRAHDRCYAAFGYDDCGCDQNLGVCAERTVDPGWYMVATWAYEKSCN